jgi:hypothetical protein
MSEPAKKKKKGQGERRKIEKEKRIQRRNERKVASCQIAVAFDWKRETRGEKRGEKARQFVVSNKKIQTN